MAEKSPLFDAINCINNKTKPNFDPNDVSGYMLCLWLAQDKSLIKYVNQINPYIFSLDNKTVFKYFYKVVPKGKRYIKWTKKENLEIPEEVKELMLKYNISENEAKLSL